MDEMHVEGRTIVLSNTHKVFFPESGWTKGDLIRYYYRIAEMMLPYLRGRPLTLQRFPDGIAEKGFYQRHAPEHFPEWVRRVAVEADGDASAAYIACEDKATLVYLANYACVTPHVWLSRTDDLARPDRLVFDLDPPEENPEGARNKAGFVFVRGAALALHDMLENLGLSSYVMTTGSRGLHVVCPLRREQDFDEVRRFARTVADVLVRQYPGVLTTEQRKEKRGQRVYLDVQRNAYAQSGVAPYAVRARRDAPVAAPLDWSEVQDRSLTPRRYTVHNIFRRLGQKEDPWAGLDEQATSLGAAQGRLGTLQADAL